MFQLQIHLRKLFFSLFTVSTISAYLAHQDLTRNKHFSCPKRCTALPPEWKKQTRNWRAKADESYQCTRLTYAISLCCSHKSHPCSLVFRNCGNQQTVLKVCNLSHSAAGGDADSSAREGPLSERPRTWGSTISREHNGKTGTRSHSSLLVKKTQTWCSAATAFKGQKSNSQN